MRTIIHKKGNSYIRHAIHLTIAQKASGAHGRQKIKCIVQHISQFTSSRAAELWIVALLLLPQLLLCCGVVKLGQGFCHDLTRRMAVLSCSVFGVPGWRILHLLSAGRTTQVAASQRPFLSTRGSMPCLSSLGFCPLESTCPSIWAEAPRRRSNDVFTYPTPRRHSAQGQ